MKQPTVRGKDKKTNQVKQQAKPAFDDLHARINLRAYDLYLQRGCGDGRAEEDWLNAEREILDRETAC